MTTDGARGPGLGAWDARSRRRTRLWVGVATVLALVASFPLRRAAQLAADPVGEKDCGPECADPAAGTPPRLADASRLPWAQRGGTVNDASCLNRTPVHGMVAVRATTTCGRRSRLRAPARAEGVGGRGAPQHGRPGVRRSALLLDMRGFNRIPLDAERRDRHGAERRHLARHPAAAAPALRGEGDAVDRHLLGRRLDLGERARHGPPRRARSAGRCGRCA